MKRDLFNKRIVITGASSGIGRALAIELAKCKSRMVLVGRTAAKLAETQSLVASAGGESHVLVADVTDPMARKNILTETQNKLGGLDLLINNAGIASWGHFQESSEEILRQIMEVNFFAPVELTRLAIPYLVKGNAPAVVNVSSMCGRRAMPAWPEYSASKFALCGMTESLRAEFVRLNIDLLMIVPGLTQSDLRTNMLRNDGKAKLTKEDGMKAEVVAKQIVSAIQKNKREVVLGADAKWMLRLNRWMPGLLDKLVKRKVRKLYGI